MLSFHSNEAIKAKLIARMDAHAAADEITQGIGWENGKGCFIGCSLNNYDHSKWPKLLGLPEWLARLCDTVFEGLPNDEAKAFAIELPRRIPVGRDLEPVRHMVAIARMDRLLDAQRSALEAGHLHEAHESIQMTVSALEIARHCHEADLAGNACDWSAARSAAWSAAESAELAAELAESAARSAAYIAERDALYSALAKL